LNTENHKIGSRILVIPNSIYSTLVIYENLRQVKNTNINVDILFIDTTNNFVRDLTLNLLSLLPNITVKKLQTELQTIQITNFIETRRYRKEFIKNNGDKVKSSTYDEILSANPYILGLLLRYHKRKKIRIVAHGLSDLVKEKNPIKNFLIKFYGEIEQSIFGFSINQRFFIKRILLSRQQMDEPMNVWSHAVTNTLTLDLVKPTIILLLPHIPRVSKENYIQRILNKLDKLEIKNENIYCKSHPSIAVDSPLYDNDKIVDDLNKIESQTNKFVNLHQKNNLEMYLSESTKILVGELSTSMLTCAYLIPSTKIVLMDFTDIFEKSISEIKKDKSINRDELKKIKNILQEFKFLYKSFNKSKELKRGINHK
jgi:hypothetical protein